VFNTTQFLKDFNIPFDPNSKNASKGFINIKCVFCEDHSDHLGISTTLPAVKCWKCGKHSLYDTIQKLLPFENPKQILKEYDTNFIIHDKIEKKLNYNNTEIKLPGSKLEKCHKLYLQKREFNSDYIEEKYKLQGTLYDSKFPYSIIIPIYFNNKLVTYQTRGIAKDTKYINCLPENEIIPIKNTLYNIDNCKEDYIIVTEGVFKVMKLGDNSCATFGKNFTNMQIKLLSKYQKIFIYFDPDEAGKDGAEKLHSILDSIGKEVYIIDNDIPPDNLNSNQVKEVWQNIYKFV